MTEDEMVGWHHRLNGHEFEQSLGDSEDREAWHAVHGVAKSRTGLSDGTATTTTHLSRILFLDCPREYVFLTLVCFLSQYYPIVAPILILHIKVYFFHLV